MLKQTDKPSTVIFRTDASLEIGTGHVMRCLTLALGLSKAGSSVGFLCREQDGSLIDLIKSFGFSVCALPPLSQQDAVKISETDLPYAVWLGCNWQVDVEHCRAVLCDPVDWIIVDHYALDYRWEKAMRDKCHKMMCIDDLADRVHECDLLLDQNLGRTEKHYRELVSPETRLLLGPQYALLRGEFAEWRNFSLNKRKQPQLRHLLVTMGGVDSDNMTAVILKIIDKSQFVGLEHITVVLGPHAPWTDNVKELASKMSLSVTILSSVNNMAELMARSDLAIGAGGTTTWERCCLGIPTVIISLAANQRHISKEVCKAGAAILCQVKEVEVELENILCEVSDPERLQQLSWNSSQITDGRGMQLVSQILGGS
jgi:UDP-2,4-diacetamido-2,4,6-trideoxy-beta-L-altropyranose hydrolase